MRQWPERRERRARIEIIPMIDVMLFLLAFFVLISSNVLPDFGLKVALPAASQPDSLASTDKLTLTITREGGLFIDGVAIPDEGLGAQLARIAAQPRVPAIMIIGDAGAPLQALVDVLDRMKAAGLAAATIIAKPK